MQAKVRQGDNSSHVRSSVRYLHERTRFRWKAESKKLEILLGPTPRSEPPGEDLHGACDVVAYSFFWGSHAEDREPNLKGLKYERFRLSPTGRYSNTACMALRRSWSKYSLDGVCAPDRDSYSVSALVFEWIRPVAANSHASGPSSFPRAAHIIICSGRKSKMERASNTVLRLGNRERKSRGLRGRCDPAYAITMRRA